MVSACDRLQKSCPRMRGRFESGYGIEYYVLCILLLSLSVTRAVRLVFLGRSANRLRILAFSSRSRGDPAGTGQSPQVLTGPPTSFLNTQSAEPTGTGEAIILPIGQAVAIISDFDDTVVLRIGVQCILHVALAYHTYRLDDLYRQLSQHVVF